MLGEKTMKPDCPKETEVLIIGAGVIGLSIARELRRYGVDVTVIDRESDVGMGVSKSTAGFINMGLLQAMALVVKDLTGGNPEEEIHTEMFKMLWEGFSSFDEMAHELDIAHRHIGAVVFARNDEELKELHKLKRLSEMVPGGDAVTWLAKRELLETEPNLNPDAKAGLYDPAGTILTFGSDYVFAIYENARENGARILLETECFEIENRNGDQMAATNKGPITARFILNCAGKYADEVADMADARAGWNLVFFRGQALIFDRRLDGIVTNLVTSTPEAMKVDVVSPLLDGNILVYGGNYDLTQDREMLDTTREYYDDAIVRMKQLVPCLSERDIITSYTAVRVFNDKHLDDHLIEYAHNNRRFINVVVRMPGFTPAPQISRKVVGMLADEGLELTENRDFCKTRKGIPRFRALSDEQRDELIRRDPRYGRVVCRCETVTEGEIVEAIRRGTFTLQGVMFRTRAGMGRCQRDYCGAKIMEILARELHVQMSEVSFKGGGSPIILGGSG